VELCRLAAAIGAPAAVVAATVLWPWVDPVPLSLWSFLALGTLALNVASTRRSLRERRVVPGDERRLVAGMVVTGLSWGSLAILAMPDDPGRQTLVGLFVFLFVVANAVFTAAHRTSFHAFHLCALAAVVVGFVQAGQTHSMPFAGVLLLGGGATVFIHRMAHAASVRTATEAVRSDLLVAAVEQERARLEEANAALALLKDEYAHRATHDPLTGIANRSLLTEQTAIAVANARRQGQVCAILSFDLDRFKAVNDSLGHAGGDELLRQLVGRVQPLLRQGDVFARMGGDEFTVLLPSLERAEDAVRIAHRIVEVVGAPFDLGGRETVVGASVGIAHDADGTTDPDELLRNADAALYRAKELGRRRVEVFDAGLRAELERRIDDERRIRAALAERRITAWYQPTIELRSGSIVGAEALARWIDPELGVRQAATFVPAVEACGLHSDLSQVIWSKALRFRAGLTGLVDDGFRVRINVDPREISDDQLDRALDALERSGCPPDGIAVEVTERAIIGDLDETTRILGVIRAAGIMVELDDFGTGHSSLTLVTRLPVDGLKIDRSFVERLDTSASARAVVAATVELANRLGHEVIAEGVETEAQAAALRSMGIRYAQGYLWSPAVPGEVLRDWLIDGPTWPTRARLRAVG
jgi:diguanylate cyclase (GGDEF)-like protein